MPSFSDYVRSDIGNGPSIAVVIVSSVLLGAFAQLHWWPFLGFTWAFYGFAAFAIGYRTCMRHIEAAVATERRPPE